MKAIAGNSNWTLFLAAVFLAAGCGPQPEDEFSYGGYALEDPDAGFSSGQDLPDFEDPDLAPDPVQDEEYDADDAAQQEAEQEKPEKARSFLVRLGWGQFPFNRSLKTPTRWQGLVVAKGAKVFIVRTYVYEDRDFARPCANRSCVLLDSVTLPHHDGVLLKVIPIPAQDGTEPELLIGFKELYGRRILLSELDGISEVTVVDDLGNKVVLDAVAEQNCASGFLRGVWKRINARGGVFKGEWITSNGNVDGLMAGIWGTRKNGQRVFFGIYADPDGHHRGLLRGTYSPSPEQPGQGVFVGRWVNAKGELGGILRGTYSIPEDRSKRGTLRGKWRAACGDMPAHGFCPGIEGPDSKCLNSDAEVCEPGDNPVRCRCRKGPNGRRFCVCTDCYKKDMTGNEDVTCLEEGDCDETGSQTSACSCKDSDTDPALVDCSCN